MKLRVASVEWAAAEAAIRAIRETVFVREQAVPEELEWSGLDPLYVPCAGLERLGEAIGTARMQVQGTIGRMAVLESWRGRGVGRALLRTLLDLAAKQGLSRVTFIGSDPCHWVLRVGGIPRDRRSLHGCENTPSKDGERIGPPIYEMERCLVMFPHNI